jgi:hypothetical protein
VAFAEGLERILLLAQRDRTARTESGAIRGRHRELLADPQHCLAAPVALWFRRARDPDLPGVAPGQILVGELHAHLYTRRRPLVDLHEALRVLARAAPEDVEHAVGREEQLQVPVAVLVLQELVAGQLRVGDAALALEQRAGAHQLALARGEAVRVDTRAVQQVQLVLTVAVQIRRVEERAAERRGDVQRGRALEAAVRPLAAQLEAGVTRDQQVRAHVAVEAAEQQRDALARHLQLHAAIGRPLLGMAGCRREDERQERGERAGAGHERVSSSTRDSS